MVKDRGHRSTSDPLLATSHPLSQQRRLISERVLYLIITNTVLLRISGFVLVYGANSVMPIYTALFPAHEKLQTTVFLVQEVII